MAISGKNLKGYLEKFEDVKLIGDFDIGINGFCSLLKPKTDCITWIRNPKETSLSGFDGCHNNVVVTPCETISKIENVRFVITENPKAVFFDILNYFWGRKYETGIAEDAIVKTESIGKNVSIGHHCFIAKDVEIGDNTVIGNNVNIICSTVIGNNCHIGDGVVVGADGFGYYLKKGIPTKVNHFGGVIIGDNVEIGANTCIDRATIDDTVIGNNVKIDNLCHIAHNVQIEDNVMIVALSLIAGSTSIKKDSYIAPSAIIKDQLVIGENSLVGMGAVVTQNVEANSVVAGIPAKRLRERRKDDV